MRRLMRPALLLLLVAVVTLPAIADKAKDLYAKGQDAEARQKYEAAYDFFKQAYDLKPKDLRYRAAFERIRFEAAASIVHNGQKLRDDGKLDDAVAEFQKGAGDRSVAVHRQAGTEPHAEDDQRPAKPQPQAAGPPAGLEKKVHEAAGPVELAPISNIPITVKLTDKSDMVYRTIGQLAGINVLFDPDYTPRQIKVELNGVTLEEALEITALESKTFWRPVTLNTIFVAQDNPAKRKELEQSVLKTFYLTNLSPPTELQDVVNAIRAVLDVQRVQQLLSQNALVVRGTPDQIALAEKLVEDLDKARPEVIVDIAVMQVSKDRSRTLGLSPPTSATVTLQSNLNTTTTTYDHHHYGTTTTTSRHDGINLNTLGNLNATDFQVTIPSANLSAVMSNSDTKLIQNPQIRALDGQKASLKIGDRVPVATGSFQPGIGGVGINPLVNTQFQYLDVGVNIDITPHVHCQRRSHAEDHDGRFGGHRPVQHRRHQPAHHRPAQDRARNSPERRRGQPAGRNHGRSADQVAERNSRPGADSDPEISLRPDHAGSLGKRNCFCHRSPHYPRHGCQRDQPARRSISAPPTRSSCGT